MSVQVRCGCGQVVSADDAHRGQVVQCPYCQAGVSVPVASAARPTPTAADRQAAAADQRAAATGQIVIGLILTVIGFFLWDTPFGKLMAFGGLAAAANASQRF